MTRNVSGRIVAVVLILTVLVAGTIGWAISGLIRTTDQSTPTPASQAQAASATARPATPTPIAPLNLDATSVATPTNGTAPAASPGTPSLPAATPAATLTPTVTDVPFDPEQLYAAVSPAVVTISNKQKINPNSATTREVNAGSGLIYDARGYVITNRHVIDGAEEIDVVLQTGKIVRGTLVGQDPVADIAVIMIDPAMIPGVAVLGDSSQVRSGQRVVAIGSPLQFEISISRGIISGTDRSIGGNDGMIQTDAAISPGNSGGPLVNARGEVIGITTSTIRANQAEKLAFAIPINLAKRLAAILVANGKVTRPYIGVITELLTPARGEELHVKAGHGAYISEVTANTPAAKAGLQKGDVITAINGVSVDHSNPLSVILLGFKPGDTITVTINRDGSVQSLSVLLVERPASLDP